jgi:hypothetical protein
LEALEERTLMSGGPLSPAVPPALRSRTPLNWTAPSNNGANDISLRIVGWDVEVFDNGRLVASKLLSRTSAITLTGGLNTINDFVLGVTPAGIPTTINLRTGDDWINLGGSARNVQNLKGAVTINGVGGDNGIVVYDLADTGTRIATISSTSITGLAPAPIQFSNMYWLNIFSGTGPGSRYAITGSPSDVDFGDYGTGDSVTISSTSGRVYTWSHALDSVAFDGPTSGSNTFTGAPTWDRMAGSGFSNTAFNFPSVTANSHSVSDIANLDGASTGLNTFSADLTSAALSGLGYFIQVESFATVNVTSHSSGDAAYLHGISSFYQNLFDAGVGPQVGGNRVTGPFMSWARLTGAGYAINTTNFTTASCFSSSANDFARLADVNGNYSTDSQGNVRINDGGYLVAAMGFPAGSVTTT